MTQDQLAITLILAIAVALFLWGRWRHDVVALAALLASVLAGLLPAADAFLGFGHPAVITVACVLVLSHGLQSTGAIDAVTRRILPRAAGPVFTIAALTAIGAFLSAFMNNVGALALLMPVAIRLALKQGLPPGRILMPLAFGTILGGMTTMIGTPPNLIVAGFREKAWTGSFAMFDFTPVGLAVAVTGVLFIALVGWRIVPARKQSDAGDFNIGAYLTEVRVAPESKVIGKSLHEVERMLTEADAQIVGLVRNEMRLMAPNPRRRMLVDDILVIEAEPEALATVLSALGLALEEAVPVADDDEPPATAADIARLARQTGRGKEEKDEDDERDAGDREIVLRELVVMPDARIIGRSATDVHLRTHYGINLLAVSRQGQRSIRRLRQTQVRAGDVLLMQGTPEALAGFAAEFGCAPLAARALRIPDRRRSLLAALVMALAIGAAALGLLPAQISFAAGVLAFMLLRIVPAREAYTAVNWSVVVLLAALIPVAGAMAATGTADLLATALLERVAQGHAIFALALILVVTMTLSDFMNNAATAAIMCPLALSTAAQLGVNPDAFLMAVAVGASCAFLTPIGHQNNTLILGPGGFRFGDYWRLGLPMEIIVVAVSLPMLLWVWPL